jgi:RNA polymerase sigma-70 factor (ECF subfamily)
MQRDEPLEYQERRGSESDNAGDHIEEPPITFMPAEDFPILDPEISGATGDILGADVPETILVPKSRFFANGQHKKSPGVARSFTDQFIVKKPGDTENDEDSFFRYQKGDDKAFFILYERYKTSVYSYCAKVLLSAGLSEELVEDTFQEVFLRVSQYRHTFISGEFRAWIFTVTRNTCLSSKKRGLRNNLSAGQTVDPDNFTDEQALEGSTAINRSDDPLEMLSQKEQTDLLLKAIEELPDTYREALLLSEYEGLTYEEIGKMTGTSLSTIRIRVFRAKKRLRKVLTPIMGREISARRTIAEEEEEE